MDAIWSILFIISGLLMVFLWQEVFDKKTKKMQKFIYLTLILFLSLFLTGMLNLICKTQNEPFQLIFWFITPLIFLFITSAASQMQDGHS